MRIWVTRAQPGAEATAERLRALGHDALVEPVLEVRALAGATVDLAGVDALAFTSANAVVAFSTLADVRDLPVFAVGDRTAAAARAAGFSHVDSAEGDVETLAAHIVASGFKGTVLHPGATEPAGDLAGALAAADVTARPGALYETIARDVAPLTEFDAVLVHSPKAARIVAELLAGTRVDHIDALALSPACAAPLAEIGFRRLGVAPYPNEAAMLKLLPTVTPKDPPSTPPAAGASPSAAARSPAPKKMLGPAFWAGLLFGLVCIFLGLVVGIWGARIFPPDPARGPPPAVLPAEPSSSPGRPVARAAPAPETTTSAPAPPAEPASDPAILELKLAAAEAARRGAANAAAAAIAVSTLTQAAEASGSFAVPVEQAARALPNSPNLAALRALAAEGAPSRPALAAAFPAAAARVAVASRQPGPKASVGQRAAYFLGGFMTVRRTDQLTGPGADAVLARAERAVEAGDLPTALRELSTLGPNGRAAAGPWRSDAERRLAIERRLAALRAAVSAGLQGPAG